MKTMITTKTTKRITGSAARTLALSLALALPIWLSSAPAFAQPHSGGGGSSGGGGHAVASGGGGGGTSSGGGSSSGGSSSGGSAVSRGSGGGHAATGGSGVAISRGADTNAGSTASGGARVRNSGDPVVGTAVPRGSVPTDRGGNVVVNGGYYYPGYYSGFYSPYWYGGGYYNGGYGGYYGYYDPWFGGYPTYGQPVYGSSYSDEGSLRLKITPKEAEVFVDGYYVGIVDDYNGIFQKLHLESGAHRVEVRADGYEPLSFDVRITPDHKTTYHGELKKIQ